MIEKAQEFVLEFAAGDGLDPARLENSSHRGCSWPTRVTSHQPFDRIRIKEPQSFGFVHGPLEPPSIEHGSKVEHCSRNGRDGDAITIRNLVGLETVLMKLNPRVWAPTSTGRYFDEVTRCMPDPPKGRCRSVTEYRASSTGKYSGHPSALGSEGPISNGIDTPSNSK
jgi:hypothetical protein